MSRTRRSDQPKGALSVAGGGTSAAPSSATYIVQTATTALSAERVLTDTATVTWDFGTAGQAKANASGATVADGDKGDIVVSGSGATWLLDSTIAGTAGGRTIYGGNAANDDLHLYSTSHATKGYVYVHDDLVIGDAGAEAGGISINGTTYEAICGIHDIGGTRAASLHLHRHSTTLQNYLLATRSATEDNTHAALASGDVILTMMGAACTGTHYDQSASIEFLVGAGTVTGTSSPGRIRLRTTPDGSQTPTTRVDILANGQVNVTNGLDVGGTLTAQTGDATTAGLLKLGASGGALGYDATTAYTRTLLDDADAATARTTLGVTQPSTTAYTSPGTTSAVAAPAWATLCYFRIVGGGGGGGSGRRGAASSIRAGAGGGAGAGYIEGWVHVSQLSGGTLDVTVGGGGGGGAAVTTNSTDGADGTAGGASYLQTGGTTIAYAPGGPGGAKGTSSGGATGGTAVTATAQWPGGNGGGVGAAGSASVGGPGGGGGGASITASSTYTNTNGAGGAGATSRTGSATGIGGGDTQGAGATGTTPALPSTYQPGSGGAGGAAGNTAASVAGGGGGSGRYGGGGGGGGGSTNSQNSGAGGAGGDGFAILTWV